MGRARSETLLGCSAVSVRDMKHRLVRQERYVRCSALLDRLVLVVNQNRRYRLDAERVVVVLQEEGFSNQEIARLVGMTREGVRKMAEYAGDYDGTK